jgi:hypothetical protein
MLRQLLQFVEDVDATTSVQESRFRQPEVTFPITCHVSSDDARLAVVDRDSALVLAE